MFSRIFTGNIFHLVLIYYVLFTLNQSVTLGDEEARKRKVQKTILERKGPPTFTCAVEMISRTQCRVHHRLDLTVDALLAGILEFAFLPFQNFLTLRNLWTTFSS